MEVQEEVQRATDLMVSIDAILADRVMLSTDIGQSPTEVILYARELLSDLFISLRKINVFLSLGQLVYYQA